jgi:hypothetical protein
MDKEQSMVEHIELLSVVKDQLNEIPADLLIQWNNDGDTDDAQFVFMQFLKQTIREESKAWIKQYVEV